MVGGFNTNVRHCGRLFHVQTEDSGVRNPKIVTLLYEGGTILCSRKSTYGEHVSSHDLESVVKQLMEEQHRAMLEAVREGDLDDVLGVDAKTQLAVAPPVAVPVVSADPGPFGARVITGRTLDEVILAELLASANR